MINLVRYDSSNNTYQYTVCNIKAINESSETKLSNILNNPRILKPAKQRISRDIALEATDKTNSISLFNTLRFTDFFDYLKSSFLNEKTNDRGLIDALGKLVSENEAQVEKDSSFHGLPSKYFGNILEYSNLTVSPLEDLLGFVDYVLPNIKFMVLNSSKPIPAKDFKETHETVARRVVNNFFDITYDNFKLLQLMYRIRKLRIKAHILEEESETIGTDQRII